MFQSPVKNTNEITNNANTICPFKFFEVGGINYQNQPTFCGKNRSLIRSCRFLDKNDMQLLQSLIIITQAGRDISLPLTPEGQLSVTGGCTGIHVLVVYMCS